MEIRKEVEKMKKEIKEVKEESFAYEMLKEQRTQNKRLFISLIIALCMWFATGVYLVYILNDIGVEEIVETETVESYEIDQDSGDNGNNNFINGNDNEVNNG